MCLGLLTVIDEEAWPERGVPYMTVFGSRHGAGTESLQRIDQPSQGPISAVMRPNPPNTRASDPEALYPTT